MGGVVVFFCARRLSSFSPFLFLILWWSRNCRPFFFRRVIESPSSSFPLKHICIPLAVCVLCCVVINSCFATSFLFEWKSSLFLSPCGNSLCGGQNQPPSRARPLNERTNEREKIKGGKKKGPAIVFDSSKVILFNSQSWKTINHSSASPRSIIVYAVHRRYVHIRPKRGIVNLSGGHHHRVMDDRDPRDQGALAPPTTFSFHSSTTLK